MGLGGSDGGRRQMCYYTTFSRLQRECRIENLPAKTPNLAQFLSNSDAIWPVSVEFKVLTYLGGGPVLTSPSNNCTSGEPLGGFQGIRSQQKMQVGEICIQCNT
jgi:hypothetical protein